MPCTCPSLCLDARLTEMQFAELSYAACVTSIIGHCRFRRVSLDAGIDLELDLEKITSFDRGDALSTRRDQVDLRASIVSR